MIYNTGTISVSGNTATGTGTNWTAAASQVRAGQTLIVLSNPVQMFQIMAVNSATSLAVTPAASPALSGQKYGILVSDTMSLDGLAQAMSQLINEYDENIGAWEAFASTTANQNITVTINGVSMTIPALGKLLQKSANGTLPVESGGTGAKDAAGARLAMGWVSEALPVSLGGTGGNTQAAARTGLGLGTAATLDVGTSQLNVVTVESSGIGGMSRGNASVNINTLADRTCFLTATGSGPTGGVVFGFNVVHAGNPGGYNTQVVYRASRAYLRSLENGVYTSWNEFYTTANTTKASDGTLKAASPVARIVKSREECQRPDLTEDGFAWCGAGACNEEAEGIVISRLDTGEYKLTGSVGLAKSGWRLLPPRDPDGSGDLGIVEAEETESGGITVRLYRRRYVLGPSGDIEIAKGELTDVPYNSWIDIRLDMPENSIWNLKMSSGEEVLKHEDTQS